MQQYYSITEVATILGMARVTVYNWVTTGKLKGVKFGKNWRISETELKRFIERGI